MSSSSIAVSVRASPIIARAPTRGRSTIPTAMTNRKDSIYLFNATFEFIKQADREKITPAELGAVLNKQRSISFMFPHSIEEKAHD